MKKIALVAIVLFLLIRLGMYVYKESQTTSKNVQNSQTTIDSSASNNENNQSNKNKIQQNNSNIGREHIQGQIGEEQFALSVCGDNELGECIDFFEKHCNSGNYLSCGNVGMLYRIAGDYTNAHKYMDKSCAFVDSDNSANFTRIDGQEITIERNEVKALRQSICHNLGNLHIEGKYVQVDFSKAIKPFEVACELGMPMDCRNAGIIYLQGGNGVLADIFKALKNFNAGCNLGDNQSCQILMSIR